MKNFELSVQNGVNNQITMTSREFAKFFDKRHNHVLEDIKNDIVEIENSGTECALFFQGATYVDFQGKERPEYILTKQGALFMAARYDTVMRLKLIQHIVTLEQKVLDQQAHIIRILRESEERMTELYNSAEKEVKLIKQASSNGHSPNHQKALNTINDLREENFRLKMRNQSLEHLSNGK